ncbi:MAG: PKD domain-containing protein, partial [Halobacteriales archaeon]|nr:PKD domain-containing protein [Halobacteriales archaeon]
VGNYTIQLRATDDDGAVGEVTGLLAVQNIVGKRPFANLTADPITGRAPLAVNFTIQGTDPDGSIVNWTLDYGDGTNATGPGTQIEEPFTVFPAHVYTEGGDYDVGLRTLDSSGNIGTGRLLVHVDLPENRAPRPTFTVLPDRQPAKNSVVRFNDTSVDPDRDDRVAQWRWDFGDGTLYCCDRPTVDHVYTRAGLFNVTLAATDVRGATAVSPPVQLTVQGQAPAVLLGAQPTSGRAPLSVNFTTGARDSDGRIERWVLDFGDGQRENGTGPPPNRTLEHVYIVPGVFGAAFQSVDDDGLLGQQVVQVQVQQPLPPALELSSSAISAGPVADQRLTYQFAAVPDVAHAASYAWSFGDGHTGTGRQVSYAYEAPGTYQVNLTVTDAGGAVLATARTSLEVMEERTSSGPAVRSDIATGVVRIGWDKDARAAGYQVWRANGANPDAASFQVLAIVRGQTSYSDLNVRDGAVYTYRVTFFSPNGDGRFESLAELNRLTAFRLLGSTTATALIDSDGDGVGDATDAAPHDPSRTTGNVPGFDLPLGLCALGLLALAARRRQS